MTISKHIIALLIAVSLTGCRTGIRRVANSINGQGVTSIDYKHSHGQNPETAFSYLTSENSAIEGNGWIVTYDPERGTFDLSMDAVSIVRSPSENQQFFAGQLAQGRAADTEAIAQYSAITGAVVEGAVKAAIQAFVPAYTARQSAKTERRQISADRDVSLAELHAEAAEHAPVEPAGASE